MDGRPNRRNKAVFSNFSSVVWTLYGKVSSFTAAKRLENQSFSSNVSLDRKRILPSVISSETNVV